MGCKGQCQAGREGRCGPGVPHGQSEVPFPESGSLKRSVKCLSSWAVEDRERRNGKIPECLSS